MEQIYPFIKILSRYKTVIKMSWGINRLSGSSTTMYVKQEWRGLLMKCTMTMEQGDGDGTANNIELLRY